MPCKQRRNVQCHRRYNSGEINETPSGGIPTWSQYAQTFNISLIMTVSLHETENIENADIGEVPLDQIF